MSARYQPPSFNWIKERELFIKLFDGDNQQEGVNAFLEKRSPEWK
jgi:enoyl-CoA hydratase/carnithine racemase